MARSLLTLLMNRRGCHSATRSQRHTAKEARRWLSEAGNAAIHTSPRHRRTSSRRDRGIMRSRWRRVARPSARRWRRNARRWRNHPGRRLIRAGPIIRMARVLATPVRGVPHTVHRRQTWARAIRSERARPGTIHPRRSGRRSSSNHTAAFLIRPEAGRRWQRRQPAEHRQQAADPGDRAALRRATPAAAAARPQHDQSAAQGGTSTVTPATSQTAPGAMGGTKGHDASQAHDAGQFVQSHGGASGGSGQGRQHRRSRRLAM